uniref:Cytochrome P450 n=1 Tax=Acrobeloides nanus TaxID=290746 RepID=A0A914D9Q9_9BILA
MGRTIIEDMIMKEVDRLLAKANESIKTGNKDFQLSSIVEICIGSIINQILLGYRFIGETEQEFYEIKNIMTKGIQIRGNPLATIVMFYPRVLKHLPYFRDYWKELNEAGQIFQDFISKQISSQLETFKLEGSPEEATNFGEAFFIEMHRREQNGDTNEFNLLQLRNLLIDLWIAGQETTTNTTNFGILYLLTHPEAQAKMQMELDKTIGNERRVTLADRSDLPYTNAVINETQRLCNLLPQNVLHYTTKDVVINGYKIAKGTTIAPQISCLLYDKDVCKSIVYRHKQQFDIL